MAFVRLDGKLQTWVDEGLLDEASAERIRTFEGEASRPMLLWALTILGALAILLGAASLVAANWEEIPGGLRLTVHFAIIAATAAAHFALMKHSGRWGGQWFSDARLWLIAGLGLAFFFHLEEVYDRDLPVWQPMLAWLIGFSPLLLGDGRTVSTALGWAAGLVTFAIAFVANRADLLGDLNDLGAVEGVLWAAVLILPSLAGMAGLRRDNGGTRGDFWSQIAAIGLYWQFLAANYLYLWGLTFWPEEGAGLMRLCLPFAAMIVMIALASMKFLERKEGRALIGMATISAVLLLIAPYRPEGTPGAMIFLLAWALIALIALDPGWRQIFQGAVAIIALRLVILTFELSDNLLGSGVGFILAGVALFVFASIAIRVGKGFAPARRSAAEDRA